MITLDEFIETQPALPRHFAEVLFHSVKSAFNAIQDPFNTISKKEFLTVLSKHFDIIYFIGKAYEAAAVDKKRMLAIDAFHLFDKLSQNIKIMK